MPKKVVSYTLTSEGTIPEYIQDGGHFPNNGILVGVTKEDAVIPSSIITFADKASLVSYLETYTQDWIIHDFPAGTSTPFDASKAAQIIFDKVL